MSKNDLQSRPERLVDQYRDIGPAVLVAACKATHRTGNQQRSNLDRPSILAVKNRADRLRPIRAMTTPMIQSSTRHAAGLANIGCNSRVP